MRSGHRRRPSRGTSSASPPRPGPRAAAHVLPGLPADLPAALFVVLHRPAHRPQGASPDPGPRGPAARRRRESTASRSGGPVYVAPADHHLLVVRDHVRSSGPRRTASARPPTRCSARRRRLGPGAVVVVLSGALADGAAGGWASLAAGGAVCVQDPADALVSGMPLSAAIAVTPAGRGARSRRGASPPRWPALDRRSWTRHRMSAPDRRRLRGPARVPQAHARARLHRLQADEPGAPRSAADGRRSAAAGFTDYLDYLEVHPDEFAQLFNTILINVTGVLPRPARRGSTCATDVRPAARSADAAGRRADPGLVRRLRVGRGGVHARDGAGRGARRGGVPRAGEDLRHRRRRGGARPGPRRRRIRREQVEARAARRCSSGTSSAPDTRYAFRKDLRRSVIFGRHDLVQDAPISRIDLLRLPQHADVLQRRDAGADPRAASTSRCADDGVPVPRQGRDAAHARATCSRRST